MSLDADPRAEAERAIRAAAEAGDLAGATTAALQTYGDELLGYLRATARDDDVAAEAYADFSEDLWRGLAKFRWKSSLRTWLYTLARNALGQLRRDPRRRAARNQPLSIAAEVAEVVRTQTREIQRTEVKDRFRTLHAQLDPEEHELLLLRLDRGLAWKDIARVMGGDDDLAARAATLRKRFERAKERLKKLAIASGLL